MKEVDLATLYKLMMNEGNFIDIQSWIDRTESSYSGAWRRWRAVAKAVVSTAVLPQVHVNRTQILRSRDADWSQI